MKHADTSDVRSRLWETVQRINRTCMEGKGFGGLTGLFHENVVIVPPGFATRAEGRDTCLRSYEDACSQMRFETLEGSDEQIDVYGSTAVMAYKYDCVWEFQGKKHTEDGHEILVFAKEGQEWQVVWRTLIPGSRQTEVCPTEEAKTGIVISKDMRQTCQNLMAVMPVCYLTTIDADGLPHTTAMLNLRCAKEYPSLVDLYAEDDNDFCIYMTTANQSPKMARLKANAKVSVYFCDADQIIGLMLGGDIGVIEDQSLKERIWQDGWTMYYPNGPRGPEYGVIKLAPKIAKGWCRNQPFEIQVGSRQ